MDGKRVTPALPVTYKPTAEEVRQLLHRAAEHPLGTEFLAGGALDAVAAAFGAHAFVVEAARGALRQQGAPGPLSASPRPGAASGPR